MPKKLKSQDGPALNVTVLVIFLFFVCILLILFIIVLQLQTPEGHVIRFIYKPNFNNVPDFTDYDYETQGRVRFGWREDEKGLARICDFYKKSMKWLETAPRWKTTHARNTMEEFIGACTFELRQTDLYAVEDFQGFPWGNNWYEFSIVLTTMLGYYMVHKYRFPAVTAMCSELIQKIIIDPQHSLGYDRDKANSAMMVFPWSLAKHLHGTFDPTNEAFLYAVAQYNFIPDQTLPANMDGIHLDYSYLTHSGVYAYGYIDSIVEIYPDAKQVIPEIPSIDEPIDGLHALLKHKTIPFSGATLWNRQANVHSSLYTGKQDNYGFKVMPGMRYLRYFTPEFQWCSRAGQGTIAYYECDKTVQNMGLYSTLCRHVYYSNETSAAPRFPVAGFIAKKGATELPSVEPTLKTTTPYKPKFISSTRSYVFSNNEDYAISRMWYMEYTDLIGPTKFDETIIFNFKTNKLTAYYWVDHGLDYGICVDDKNFIPMEELRYKMHIDFSQRTYTGEPYTTLTPSIASMTGSVVSIKEFGNGGKAIAFYRGEPYCATPAETDIMTVKEFSIKTDDIVYLFKFDAEANQFLFTKYGDPALYTSVQNEIANWDSERISKKGVVCPHPDYVKKFNLPVPVLDDDDEDLILKPANSQTASFPRDVGEHETSIFSDEFALKRVSPISKLHSASLKKKAKHDFI